MTRVREVSFISSQTHRDCGRKGGIVDASKEKEGGQEKVSQEKEALTH
jgi:hypothetical protein